MISAQTLLLFLFYLLLTMNVQVLLIYYLLGFLLMTFNYGYFNAQVSLTKLSVPYSELKFSESNSFWGDLQEAWTLFKTIRPLWMLTICVVFLNASMIIVNTTVIFYATEQLQLPASLVAAILSTAGIGGLIGSLGMNRLRKKFPIGVLFVASAGLNSLCYFGLTFANSPRITGSLFRIGMLVTMYASGWMMLWWGASSVFICAAIINVIVFSICLRSSLIRLT